MTMNSVVIGSGFGGMTDAIMQQENKNGIDGAVDY